jgi:class IV lanthipeptide synthase
VGGRPAGEKLDSGEPPARELLSGPELEFRPMLVKAVAGRSSPVWRIEANPNASSYWVVARHEASRQPEQGWKLHVAADGRTAEAVLRRALPVLIDEDADFKVIASRRRLAELNEGHGGLGQVGKFITVYPNDDSQAVRLACALDAATSGLRGPAIPSDRALRPRSLVHYRYGGFGGRYVRTLTGEILPSIATPDGTLVPDRRLAVYYAPPWAVDPFVAAGVAEEIPAPTRLIGSRYVLLATLHRSPRSTVELCLDIDVPRRCVLKRVSDDGSSSFDRLRHEADVLTRLTPDPRFPAPYALFEENGELFLAMEDIEGQTIEHALSSLKESSTLPAPEQVVRWGCELATMLDTIHAKGLAYGDLKASNVIVAPDGQLRLLDFELACERDGHRRESAPHYGRGTQGYMSPHQAAGHPPDVADDVYGLGAFLYLIATGAEPSRAPSPSALLDRPIELLNPAVGSALARVIGRCLDPAPAHRFASAAAVATALMEAGRAGPVSSPPFGGERAGESEPISCQRLRELARRLGDTICTVALRAPDGRMTGWANDHLSGDTYRSVDLNAGGGPIIALAELVAEFDDPVHRATLTAGVRWLAEAPRPLGPPFPGLYVGEAGVGVAQLRAGRALGDASLITKAAERGRWIATLPLSSPDMFNGTAGRLRFHLWLWDATSDAAHLDHAIAAGEQLLAVAAGAPGGGLRWTIPPGCDSMSGKAWLGYAHGAAGIGDALLDLFEVTSDGRFLEAARGAGLWLEKLARPALDDGSGLNWPISELDSSAMAFWCHGAAGVGRFMLHLGKLGAMPSASQHAERAALVVARGVRWSGATQCHGLAGSIEFLLDMYQAIGDHAYLREATSLAQLLNAFAREVDGLLYWVTDSEVNPGFSAGYAGVATCLLRLAYPETLPHVLSRAGLRRGRNLSRLALIEAKDNSCSVGDAKQPDRGSLSRSGTRGIGV